MIDPTQLQEQFAQVYGTRPTLLASGPGRVNLIGEHTDYSGGFVLPAAIERHVLIAAAPADARSTRLYSVKHRVLHACNPATLPPKPGSWPSYFLAVQDQFVRRGCTIPPLDVVIDGDVPLGAGLSSSAAYGVAAACLYNRILGTGLTPTELALLAQAAENGPLIGMRCGIMDQFISANGQDGKAVLLDCHSLEFRLVEFARPSPLILVINSMKQRGLVESAYNERRSQGEEALRVFQGLCSEKPATLRHITADDFARHEARLTPQQRRRVRHNLTENARVLAFATAVEAGDWAAAGKLLYASHESLRDDYEVSCPELDAIVELARATPGVHGCRMTGAGFGGCCVALVEEPAVELLREALALGYTSRFNLEPQLLVTRPSRGASVERV
jgi:galactokinase